MPLKTMVKNLIHVHDKCNGHASTTINEVVKYAVKNGYKKIVYTEHCPLDGNKKLFRPSEEDIKKMREKIDAAQKKYKGKIEIYFGYEAEYPKAHRQYFENLKNTKLCDYMIFGNHFYGDMWGDFKFVAKDPATKEDLQEYYELTADAFKSGLFSYFAHPDIWVATYCREYGFDKDAKELTKKLIALCEKYDMAMGFNANGMHSQRDGFNYPSEYFWKMVAKSKAKVIIESDAHDMNTLSVEWMNKTYCEAIKYGLEERIVDDVKLKFFDGRNDIKGAVFDLDGVLTETSELHYQAWKTILKKYKINLTKTINEQVKGLPRKETLVEILKLTSNTKKIPTKELDAICEEKNNIYLKLLTKITSKNINPGILDLLKDLRKNNIKMAISSSSKNAPLILDKLKITKYFDYIADPTKVKNPKPAPDIYLLAAKGIDVKPENCIGFEDALMGVTGLNKGKIFSVGINPNKDVQKISKIAFNSTADIKFSKIKEVF